jgi:serine/threonine protein kinase/tetratricopeptide (TPR) repeat protein
MSEPSAAGSAPPVTPASPTLEKKAGGEEGRPAQEALLDDQARRWGRGERLLVETYLAQQPALSEEPEAVLDLLYHEVVLREARGEGVDVEEYIRRFPQWAAQLRLHFQVHRAIDPISPKGVSAGSMTYVGPPGLSSPPSVGRDAGWPLVPGYDIEAELGRGGMGVVYKARHRALNRVVALKMFSSARHAGPHEMSRFRREAEVVAQLQHPHIVQIYEVGEQDGQPFFAMEFIAGGSLDRLVAGTPQPAREAARLVETLARTMHHAHENGIIHRDLKPANVLLIGVRGQGSGVADQASGVASRGAGVAIDKARSASSLTPDPWPLTPKITDFGLAKLLDAEEAGPTKTGDLLGTPSYMAPEQIEARIGAIGPAADVYGLGTILYELLTGRPPFKAETAMETLLQVKLIEPVSPSRFQPKLARDLVTICLRCLHKEPRRRYPNALALAEDLRRFLDGEPVQARPVSRGEKLWRWCRRKPLVAALLASVTLLALFVLVGTPLAALWWRQQRDTALHERDRAERQLKIVQDRVDQLDRLGNELMRKPGLHRAGQDVLKQALGFYEDLLPEEGNDPTVREEAAKLFGHVAWIQFNLGQGSEAAKAWDNQARLLSSLLKQRPANADLRMGLADCHRWRGNALRQAGKDREAREAYDQAAGLHDDLRREFPDKARYKVALANTLLNTASLLWDQNQAEELDPVYQRILGLYRGAVEAAPDNRHFNAELALGLEDQGQFSLNTGRVSQAEKAVREGLRIRRRLLASGYMKDSTERSTARSLVSLGRVLAATSRVHEAEQSYREAITLLDRPVQDSPESALRQADLAGTLAGLAGLLKEPDRRSEAEEIRRRVIRIREKLTADFPENSQYRRELVLSYLHLASLLWELGRQTETAQPYRKALEQESEDPAVNNELAWFLATGPEAGLRDAGQAVRLAKKAVAAQPQSRNYRNTLGVALYRHGDDKAVVEELETAMTLGAGGNSVDWFFLAMAHWRLGNRDQARTWFDRAVQWMEKNKPHDDELRRFRAEAETILAEGRER